MRLLACLADDNWNVCHVAARVLAGGIIAEKFGLPAGEIDPVYP